MNPRRFPASVHLLNAPRYVFPSTLLSLALLLSFVPNLKAQASPSNQQAASNAAKRGMDSVHDRCDHILTTIPPPAQSDSGGFGSDCDSTQFYFGIGRKPDFILARQCAFAERATSETLGGDIFGGPAS